MARQAMAGSDLESDKVPHLKHFSLGKTNNLSNWIFKVEIRFAQITEHYPDTISGFIATVKSHIRYKDLLLNIKADEF